MNIVVHYKTGDHIFTTASDSSGSASSSFSMDRPAKGYKVKVDVSDEDAHCTTSFTPR